MAMRKDAKTGYVVFSCDKCKFEVTIHLHDTVLAEARLFIMGWRKDATGKKNYCVKCRGPK